MKLLPALLAAGLSFPLAFHAGAQAQAPEYINVPLEHDSGFVANTQSTPQVVVSFPIQLAGSSWMRLYFEDVQLSGDLLAGNGAVLRLTSWLDGEIQELNARHLKQWQNSSAYFNGDTVQVELFAYPGTGGNRVQLRSADLGQPFINETQCGPTDDRVFSTDPRIGRLLPITCTGWLIDDCAGCALTAGHCAGSLSVLQFNVPLSNSNGSLNNPPVADQYVIDQSSIRASSFPSVGNDWAYFGTFPNSVTGLTAAEAQGSTMELGDPPPIIGNNMIRITGYGTDTTVANHTQQTHAGPLVSALGNFITYETDTEGGNSGSPVIHEQTGLAVGIHTHGGCNSFAGNNLGTSILQADLQAALHNPIGVCGEGGIAFVGTPPFLVESNTLTTVRIEERSPTVPGTQVLHYRTNPNDLFTEVPMNALGLCTFEADLPGFACSDEPDFFVSSQDLSCGLITLPANAPVGHYSATVGTPVLSFSDNFETDMGWDSVVDGATAGEWERGVPLNVANWPYDPESDADGSGQCYLTMNQLGNSDVDNGTVRLISPVLDLSSGTRAVFYSYYLNLNNEEGADRLVVAMRETPTSLWVDVDFHDRSNGLEWTPAIVLPSTIASAGLSFTSTMQVRFSANDSGLPSAVEAGIDAFQVGTIACSDPMIGSVYCAPAVPNSTGQPAILTATGSTLITNNQVELLATRLPAGQFGFFLTSMTQGFNPNPGGSQGNLCLAGNIGRYNMPVLNSGPVGVMSQSVDVTSVPQPAGNVSVLSGQTWNFQAWHRDLNPGATSNFTSAVSIVFQ